MERTASVPLGRLGLPNGFRALVLISFVVGALTTGYRLALTPVTLVVDGQARQLRTHQDTVQALLMDVGLTVHAEDIVVPDRETSIEPGLTVQVEHAHPVQIAVDGREFELRTHASSVDEVLTEAGVSLEQHDRVEVEGEFPVGNPEPARITVHRAVPFTLHEEGQAFTLYTTASTVGEALRQAGLTLHLADHVQPRMSERLSAGMHVYIARSIPVAVQMDGRTIRTRTHRDRVDDVLADLGIVLAGQDYTVPAFDAHLKEDLTIQVVRVTERFLIEQEPIPFESVWQPDPEMEIDHQGLLQEGAPGVRERRIRVRYENGNEVSRQVEDEYVAVPPTTKIMGYGTKIVVRTLETASGPVEYWRKIRMLATSYSASTAGVPKTSSWYGRTATGMKMRTGIVAVDPRVINLHSRVYVPGYGVGLAGDTGGAIKGRRIDLGYSDDELELWYRWVDVYLLTPVPSPEQIDYTLP